MNHEVVWTSPPALLNSWVGGAIPSPERIYRKPVILRFTSDTFMDDFMNLLQTDPERLRDYEVRRETWRGVVPNAPVQRPVTPSAVLQRNGIFRRRTANGSGPQSSAIPATPAGTPLKLYQPAHGRHYLVTSSLVCRTPGWPDRVVDAGRGETTGWVLRRLLPPQGEPNAELADWQEHAWVAGTRGHTWQSLGSDPLTLPEGEERLSLFAVHYQEGDRKRRLFAGVIPAGKREQYLAAPSSAGAPTPGTSPGATPRTARKILFRRDVVEPWKGLLQRAGEVNLSFTTARQDERLPNNIEKAARLKIERSQIQSVSWLILLDFAKYLNLYLKPVWRAILNPSLASGLTTAESTLLNALSNTVVASTLRDRLSFDSELAASGNRIYQSSAVLSTMVEALRRFGSAPESINQTLETTLEAQDTSYDRGVSSIRALWPDFLFPLADPDLPGSAALPPVVALSSLTPEEAEEMLQDENPAADDPAERLDKLAVLVLRALRDDGAPAPEPAIPAAAVAPANGLEGWFVIRTVHERPACAPLKSDVVSDATEPFQIAGFFDPDAPARPIRIGLPIDTTPAGLRKFDRNTALVISDTLCGQIKRFKGLTFGDLVLSVLPWPFHKDLPGAGGGPCKSGGLSFGMICSISIPIITLCAMILLMIMVTLFDIIFSWRFFFVLCFPVPGLKAKR